MCKLCWILLVMVLGAVSAAAWRLFLFSPPEPVTDVRAAIALNTDERALVLAEMRTFLESVQQITAALGRGDMQQLAEQARRSGLAAQRGVPASLVAKLPAPFRKLGFDTHAGFDRLALDAEQLGDREHALVQLGVLMQNCTACHAAYRFTWPESVSPQG
jgi:hypothetical protein